MSRRPFNAADIGAYGHVNEATDALASSVIGAAIEVHRTLGPGYIESVYEKALCIELTARQILFVSQRAVRVEYRGFQVGEGKVDMLVADMIVLEFKVVEALAPVHTAQLLAYLKATGYPLGLLINFNVAVLKDGIKRVILSQQ